MPIVCEFDTQNIRRWYEPQPDTHAIVTFPRPFLAPPRLPNGIRQIDIGYNANIRVKSSMEEITASNVDTHITTWADTTLFSSVVDILALAPGDLEFQTGEHTHVRGEPDSARINFDRPFVTPPTVVAFFNHIDLDKGFNWRLKTTVANVDVNGFILNIETWADTVVYGARACWIAFPTDREHIWATSVNTMDVHPWNVPQLQQSRKITFGGVEFWKDPAVFVALNAIDIACTAGLRVNAYVENVSKRGLEWHIDSWADTTLYSAGATIIAFN